jgi:hypothetical protein
MRPARVCFDAARRRLIRWCGRRRAHCTTRAKRQAKLPMSIGGGSLTYFPGRPDPPHEDVEFKRLVDQVDPLRQRRPRVAADEQYGQPQDTLARRLRQLPPVHAVRQPDVGANGGGIWERCAGVKLERGAEDVEHGAHSDCDQGPSQDRSPGDTPRQRSSSLSSRAVSRTAATTFSNSVPPA